MSGWALILGWPVIMVIASGHGLLKPSFIASLQKTTQVKEELRDDEDQQQESYTR